jgi:hypothetical protein
MLLPVSLAATILGSAWNAGNRPALSDFARWTEDYLRAGIPASNASVSEGVRLAQERRAALAHLIRTDPEEALKNAVPLAVRAQLPGAITALLEERVSGRGELALVGVTPLPGQFVETPIFWSARVSGRNYRAFPYGRRAGMTTLATASIIGIAVDGALAVSDSPLRVLERGESAGDREVDPRCAVSGKSTDPVAGVPEATEFTRVEANGKVRVLCDPAHVPVYEQQLMAEERLAANGDPGTSGLASRPAMEWTHGPKKVLIIRVDFSDLPGPPTNGAGPITEDHVVNVFKGTNGVCDFYEQASYGKTSLQIAPAVDGDSPDVTAVLRLPRTAQSYAAANDPYRLHDDARQAAAAAGVSVDAYDRIGVVTSYLGNLPDSQIFFTGYAYIGGKFFWIFGAFDFATVAHEIGHNYGLQHASLWVVRDGNPISPTGGTLEYGDPFDVMGGGRDISCHFSPWNKSILQWIPDTAVATIQFSGTYRVYRYDHGQADLANTLALKVVCDGTRDYWIAHRRATTNPGLNNGAYIQWGYNVNRQGHLLDMTNPGFFEEDPALIAGATFSDTNAGIVIHPLGTGGIAPHEYLEVQITLSSNAVPGFPYGVTTAAGSPGDAGYVNGPLALARFNQPQSVAVDAGGNLYVADTGNAAVRKITPDGLVSTLTEGLSRPVSIAVDAATNIYVVEQSSHVIGRMTPGGTYSHFAGLAFNPGGADGTGSEARFSDPTGVAVDAAGNLFVSEKSTIRKITSSAVVSTIAGQFGVFGSANGVGTNALFNLPRGLTVDTAGNLYIVDSNQLIRKISAEGVVTTVAGRLGSPGPLDGNGADASFRYPSGIGVLADGTLIVVDGSTYPPGNNTIRKISLTGAVTTILGQAGTSGSVDGIGREARFNSPAQMAVDPAGRFYLADTGNSTIRLGQIAFPPAPVLEFALGENQMTFQWKISAGQYSLESASEINAPAWDPVPDTALIINGRSYVTNRLAASRKFFRLHR